MTLPLSYMNALNNKASIWKLCLARFENFLQI